MEQFEQFIKKRIYLKNVSPRTVEWYRACFKWLSKYPLTEDGFPDYAKDFRRTR